MDFLDRLDVLMESKKINKRQLSIMTGIPVSTVYGWYKKGYENITLPSLNALSDFFGCSMEYLANGAIKKQDEKLQAAEMERALTRLGVVLPDGTIDEEKLCKLVSVLELSKEIKRIFR